MYACTLGMHLTYQRDVVHVNTWQTLHVTHERDMKETLMKETLMKETYACNVNET